MTSEATTRGDSDRAQGTALDPDGPPGVVDAAAQPESGGRAARRRQAEGGTEGDGGGRATTAVLFGLPTLLALVMILPGIGDRQLWRDEYATWWSSTLAFSDLNVLIRTIDVVFAPYYAVMHIWIAVTGDSETAMRIPAAFAMAASTGLLALLGRQLFNARVGLIAGLAYAVVPSVVRYAHEIRPYAFAVAFVLLSTLFLARTLDRPSVKMWVLYAVSLPLIGWSHLAALAVLAVHLTMVLTSRKETDRVTGWAFSGSVGLGVGCVVPLVASGAGQSSQIAWVNPDLQDLIDFPQNLFGSAAVAAPVMLLGLVGLAFAGKRSAPLAVWVLLPPVVTFATAAQLHLFLPRYLLFTAPAWVLIAAVALGRLGGPVTGPKAAAVGRSPGQVMATLAALAAVAGLGLAALPGIDAARADVPGEPDYRAASAHILDNTRKGDAIAFSGGLSGRLAMSYGLRDAANRPDDVLMDRTPQQMGNYAAEECWEAAKCLADTRRLWLVSSAYNGDPYTGMLKSVAVVLKRDYKVVDTEKLKNVQVLLFERTASKPSERKPKETPEGGAEAPSEGAAEDPSEGGAEDPSEGGAEDPSEGGAEDPSEGGAEDPSEGGAEDPSEGGAEAPQDQS